MARKRPARRWVRTVKTDSTHPPPRTFSGSASEIARTMARMDVSPTDDVCPRAAGANSSGRSASSSSGGSRRQGSARS